MSMLQNSVWCWIGTRHASMTSGRTVMVSLWRSRWWLWMAAVVGVAFMGSAICAADTSSDSSTAFTLGEVDLAPSGAPSELVATASSGDVKSLFRLAKESHDVDLRLQIWTALADANHIPSQLALGFFYYETGKDKQKALSYFERAGENGPHQAALYNAGRIYAEDSQWPQAMGFVQAAVLFPKDHPDLSIDQTLTETCQQAYEILSHQLAVLASQNSLSLEDTADVFMYGALSNFPLNHAPAASQWRTSVLHLQTYQTDATGNDHSLLAKTATNLQSLWENESAYMSPLQAHLVLLHLTRSVLGLLSAMDDAYLPAAARYAELLTVSPYCAQVPACYASTRTSAIVHYRRLGDTKSVERLRALPPKQPVAVTAQNWGVAQDEL